MQSIEASVIKKSVDINHLSQSYIIEQLIKYGQKQLANALTCQLQPPTDVTQKIIKKISNQLAEEQKEQLEEICFELHLTEDTVSDTFDAISLELFRDGIKWGRIVTYIAFTGAFAVYCAEHNLKTHVTIVMNKTESFIGTYLHKWIDESGGGQAFVKHFDEQEISVISYLPTLVFGMGVTALTIASGFIFFRQKLLTTR